MFTLLYILNIITQITPEYILKKWQKSSKNLLIFQTNDQQIFSFIQSFITTQQSNKKTVHVIDKLIYKFKQTLPYKDILKDLTDFSVCTKIIDRITNTETSERIRKICNSLKEVHVDRIELFLEKYRNIKAEYDSWAENQLEAFLNKFFVELITRFEKLNDELYGFRWCLYDIINREELKTTGRWYYKADTNAKQFKEFRRLKRIITKQRSFISKFDYKSYNSIQIASRKLGIFKAEIRKYKKLGLQDFNIYLAELPFTNDYFVKRTISIFEKHKRFLSRIDFKIKAAKKSFNNINNGILATNTVDNKPNMVDKNLIEELSMKNRNLDLRLLNEETYELKFKYLYILNPKLFENDFNKRESELEEAWLLIEKCKMIYQSLKNIDVDHFSEYRQFNPYCKINCQKNTEELLVDNFFKKFFNEEEIYKVEVYLKKVESQLRNSRYEFYKNIFLFRFGLLILLVVVLLIYMVVIF